MIEIYVDGSCCGNGKENNCGGAGVCVLISDQRYLSGFRIKYMWSHKETITTNNRMELTALLHALEQTQTVYKDELCIIKSDSAYCVNMYNQWIDNWHQQGWVRAGNKLIENLDLIKQIWEYKKISFPNFRVDKISGHSGILGNEIADALATGNKTKLDKIFIENDIDDYKKKIFDL
jgi:ribonuclease HI